MSDLQILNNTFGTETRGLAASPAVIPTNSVPPNAKQAPTMEENIDKGPFSANGAGS